MSTTLTFQQLGIEESLIHTLNEIGIKTPTPVQQESIPLLLERRDVITQARTGTGKTLAYALPIISQIDLELKKPQALILAPTRELAIQVAEAFKSYARAQPSFRVTPIYGGQDYQIQLRAIKRGTHVIVSTPGRLSDHLRRKSISFKDIKTVVLDEGDEMLKMGFIDDINDILEHIKHEHVTALFSATMPASIQKIAQRYLNNPTKINIKAKQGTLNAITQLYMRMPASQKKEALLRFLESEDVQAAIIFTRTKNGASQLAEKLQAHGHNVAAMHGDMNQSMRETTINRMRRGSLNIIVATDVAARGLDVPHLSHVVNFDPPHDSESYVHRIGRTGRAGRQGKALLFIGSKGRRLLEDLERASGGTLTEIQPPSIDMIKAKRRAKLNEKIINVLSKSKGLAPYHDMIGELISQHDVTAENIAAALAYMLQQTNPLPTEELIPEKESTERNRPRRDRAGRGRQGGSRAGSSWQERSRAGRGRAEKSESGRGSQSRSRHHPSAKSGLEKSGSAKGDGLQKRKWTSASDRNEGNNFQKRKNKKRNPTSHSQGNSVAGKNQQKEKNYNC